MRQRPVSVIEFAAYRRRADELLTAGEQDAVVDLIAYEPTRGDLIPGTGGSGKRGGARVIYYFYNAEFPLLLLGLYAKNEKTDLSDREKKKLVDAVKEITGPWQRR